MCFVRLNGIVEYDTTTELVEQEDDIPPYSSPLSDTGATSDSGESQSPPQSHARISPKSTLKSVSSASTGSTAADHTTTSATCTTTTTATTTTTTVTTATTVSPPQLKGFQFLKASTTRQALGGLATLDEVSFPLRSGWLEKKMASLPYSWHPRWVIIKESWMLWSDIQVQCGDPKDKKERIKFKHISLLQVESVERIESGKTQKKFKVIVAEGNKQRELLFKCETAHERDHWVLDLQYRVNHAKNVVEFLSGS